LTLFENTAFFKKVILSVRQNEMKQIGIALLLLTLTGCGTVVSRTGSHSFGAYPYQAVATDVAVVAVEKPDVKVLAFFSIPFDLILDTLFLPPDLLFWIGGNKKDGLDSNF